jgi:hypothetical protein
MRLNALYPLLQLNSAVAYPPTRSQLFPARVLSSPVASDLDALLDPFVGLDARVCGGRDACAAPVEALEVA